MFDFFKKTYNSGIEFNNLAKSIKVMHLLIEELLPQIEKKHNRSDLEGEILTLAYVAKRCVVDRIEQYNWPLTTKISIPEIDSNSLTLMYALNQTLGKLHLIAAELELTNAVEDVMNKNPIYYRLERNLPKNIKDFLGI